MALTLESTLRNELFIQVKYCNPSSQSCVQKVAARNQQECKTSCGGLHADVTFTDDLFDTFVTKQLKEQHSNLADGKLNVDCETD